LEPCWPPFSAQDGPRGLQDGPRCPARTRELSKTSQDPPKAPKTTPRRRFWNDFIKRCWKMFGRFMRKIAVQPAFSNLLSKKACLHKFAFQKSQPKLNTGSLPVFSSRSTLSKKASLKTKGPAVIAAGVGNPPAPGLCQGATGVFKTECQIWEYFGLLQPQATPPTPPAPVLILLKLA